jgi:hypothetical protein
MTPKEKAQELYIEYNSMNLSFNHYDFRQQALRSHTKQCALLAVDEIIANIEPFASMDMIAARIEYWQQVKTEIQAL